MSDLAERLEKEATNFQNGVGSPAVLRAIADEVRELEGEVAHEKALNASKLRVLVEYENRNRELGKQVAGAVLNSEILRDRTTELEAALRFVRREIEPALDGCVKVVDHFEIRNEIDAALADKEHDGTTVPTTSGALADKDTGRAS